MPIEFVDKGEDSISGDPAPERPLSQKQMTGAMNRTVNRTALGQHPVGSAGAKSDGEADGQTKQGAQAEQGQANGKAESIHPCQPRRHGGFGVFLPAISVGVVVVGQRDVHG